MRKISTGVTGRPLLGNLFAQDNTVRGIVPNANLILDPDGTGKVTTDAPFEITNTTASNSSSTGSLVIAGGIGVSGDVNTGGDVVSGGSLSATGFQTASTHVSIPTGNTASRPGGPNPGFIRFNTDYDLFEVYTGSKWQVSGFQDVDVNSGRTSLPFQTNWVDTASGSVTVNLPGSPAKGDEVRFFDVSNTFDTNALTVGRNGSRIMGDTENLVVTTEGAAFTLVYYNASAGWRILTV